MKNPYEKDDPPAVKKDEMKAVLARLARAEAQIAQLSRHVVASEIRIRTIERSLNQ